MQPRNAWLSSIVPSMHISQLPCRDNQVATITTLVDMRIVAPAALFRATDPDEYFQKLL